MNNQIPFFHPFQGFPQPNLNQTEDINHLENKMDRLEKNLRILENRVNNLEKGSPSPKDYWTEEKTDMYML